jgi:saccharopine dehydrogenase (NAD+, L-lysine-forming)
MSKVVIIGAGGVGAVVTHKCAQLPEVFTEIVLASRTVSKCEAIAAQLDRPIKTAAIDADDVPALSAFFKVGAT